MLAWFSAFREYGAPTFYGEQRTPVTIDTQIYSILIAFFIPSLTFLIILPGVKRTKLASTLAFSVCIFVGATLAVSLYHPCWHRGEMDISTSYRAFHKDKLDAHILIRVGLAYMNITLTSPSSNGSDPMHYNERFSFTEIKEMEQELTKALKKGLPFPILKVIEYLSAEGFIWGRQYRVAGYYTKCFMLMAGISWSITVLCLCLVPPAFPKSLFWTGVFISLGDAIFFWQIPKDMFIHFPGTDGSVQLRFRLSICFQATCAAALLCLLMGSILWWTELRHLSRLDTIFTARRNTEDSIVDRRKDDSPISCHVFSLARMNKSTRHVSMTTSRILSIQEVDFLPIFVVAGVVVYSIFVLLLFLVICRACPSWLKYKPPPPEMSIIPSFSDCSFITTSCLPCPDCSLRSLLRRCCPSREHFRRYASCECCINRDPVQSDAPINFVCC